MQRSIRKVHVVLAQESEKPQPAGSEQVLTAAVASRLCHDLVNPLGAIANGLELLHLSGEGSSPELQLIAESVEVAMSRVRFSRLAYGTGGREATSRTEILAILLGLERGSRLTYRWKATGNPPSEEIKAVFLLIQCLESALPLEGRITVDTDVDGWKVMAEGPRLRVSESTWHALAEGGPIPPTSADLVPFALLPALLRKFGRRLELIIASGSILARL